MNVKRLKWTFIASLLPSISFASSDFPPAFHGHTMWVMFSAILVIFMTIPGIATFYGGLVHRRNVLSVYTQCLSMAAIASLCWLAFGYVLTFGTGDSLSYLFFGHWSLIDFHHIHKIVRLFYQMGFAMITVVIIIGGFAERMKFSAALLFTPLWLFLVYCPIAHWIWGNGWLSKLGVMDFAGGTVVHLNAGIAGLVAAIMIGKRRHLGNKPHNISIVTIGTSILWIGWFGFNSGSAHDFKSTVIALMNTQFAPCASTLSWLLVEWLHKKKVSTTGLLFGVISGLVAITPAAGFCSPYAAIAVGLISAPICYFAINIKTYIGYDDALDAFGIHGVAGMVGATLTAIVAYKGLGGTGLYTHTMIGQIATQITGVLATFIWSGCLTFVILWFLDKWIGIRVDKHIEDDGLDLHHHGEQHESL